MDLDDGGVLFVASVLKKKARTNKQNMASNIKQYLQSFLMMYPSFNGNFVSSLILHPHEHSFSLKRARMMHPKKLLLEARAAVTCLEISVEKRMQCWASETWKDVMLLPRESLENRTPMDTP